MKHFFTLLLLVAAASMLSAQIAEKPEWVALFQQGKSFPDTVDCYYGIGSSSITQDDADAKARREFALNIEARVQSVITHNVQEADNVIKEEYSATARVSSDVVLRGVSITGRFEDSTAKQFYALVQIQKSLFDTLLVTEIRRDLERKKAENKAQEEAKSEDLRSRQAALELKKKEEQTERDENELEKRQYQDFLSLKAPEEVVDLRNGEIARSDLTLALKAALSPFEVQTAYAVLAAWHFELSANAFFESDRFLKDDMLSREQASFKIQLLDQAGQFYKTSLAFGVVGYANASTLGALDSVKPKYSLFVGGDVGMPTAFNSFASAYVDARKASVGLNSYPFPGYFGDAVSFVVQMDYVWNKDWRNRFSDPLLFQLGIRFRASDAFATSFTYEGHEFLVFTVEMGL